MPRLHQQRTLKRPSRGCPPGAGFTRLCWCSRGLEPPALSNGIDAWTSDLLLGYVVFGAVVLGFGGELDRAGRLLGHVVFGAVVFRFRGQLDGAGRWLAVLGVEHGATGV